ncbi:MULTISPECIES: LytTR family DNA-binding domain-containing protein [unclassified Virgibacillus]|uniref:LytR/AlgR family response regulator transcription factor n=1 Tax=unclassified Virgibacillus TaxID=2620237 RepID=UPI0024DE34C5|nr:LytTR family DNA-binding domain-containing protein [Virgibacillus sp. LDC-1]
MNKRIKAFVVDDERYAREELIFLLAAHPSIQIIGEADTGEEAIMKIMQLQPDVVFLDVEMPKMDGLEVARSLLNLKRVPFIVFATAYPQFAAEAFRINALDYLLKPYDPAQLEQSVQRLENKLITDGGKETVSTVGKLAVEAEGEIAYLSLVDILYIYRDDKVTRIITKKGKYSIKATLKELESRLTAFSFFRIHKSYLVNLTYISKLSPWFNGAYELELDGLKTKLPVSRNYVKELRNRLEL